MNYVASGSQAVDRRPGVVLLIVMAMLALFASLALSFVFYADAEATAAQLNVSSLIQQQADIDPELLASYFLGQMLYDTDDIYSAVRGWSLSRSIYGNNPNTPNSNTVPYNGVGRGIALSYTEPDFSDPTAAKLWQTNNKDMISYVTYKDPTQPPLNKWLNFVRTPEFVDKFPFLPTANPPTPSYNAAGAPNSYRYAGGANPPYTGYDRDSMFLAQVDANGTVLLASYYRPWVTNTLFSQPYPAAVKAALAKYLSLFPDAPQTNPLGTTWWNPNFFLPDADPPPTPGKGITPFIPPQVKNLDFGKGMLNPNGGVAGGGPIFFNNDSYWMDFGFPVMTAPNGKRYKALVAPLVMDLSSRLHLWAHGNRAGGNIAKGWPMHVSNHGFGPTEVNLTRLPGFSYDLSTGPPAGGIAWGAQTLGKGPVVRFTLKQGQTHNFIAGDSVIVAGMEQAAYNGTWQIAKVVNNNVGVSDFDVNIGNLPPSGGGIVMPAEVQSLFDLRYGGLNGTMAANPGPLGAPIGFPMGMTGPWYDKKFPAPVPIPSMQTPWYSQIDADGRNPAINNLRSTLPNYGAFTTVTKTPIIVPPGKGPIQVNVTVGPNPVPFGPTVGKTGNLFPWYALEPNMVGQYVLVGNAPPSHYDIVGISELKKVVTVTTAQPPSAINVGSLVDISGIASKPYNGVFNVTSVNMATNSFTYNDPVGKLPKLGAGGVVWTADSEFVQILSVNQAAGTFKAGFKYTHIPPPAGTNIYYSYYSGFPTFAQGADSGNGAVDELTGNPLSHDLYTPGFKTTVSNKLLAPPPLPAPAVAIPIQPQTLFVAAMNGQTAFGSKWSIQPNMYLSIGAGTVNAEVVKVLSTGGGGITAIYTKGHLPGETVAWGTVLPAGTLLPNGLPLPMSSTEWLLRGLGPNGPGATSELARRLPISLTSMMRDPRAIGQNFPGMKLRQMVTNSNSYFDRVTAAPMQTALLDQTSFPAILPAFYTFPAGASFPVYNPARQIANATEKGGVVTITTNQPHGFKVGQNVVITGFIGPASGYNSPAGPPVQPFVITNIIGPYPLSTSFTYVNPIGGLLPAPGNVNTTATAYPNYGVPGTVDSSNSASVPPFKTEFSQDAGAPTIPGWRSNLGNFLRVDLTRSLPDYPPKDDTLKVMVNLPAYQAAWYARIRFARDIYQALVRVTDARDPNVIPNMDPGASDYEAARYLAQLAVNIVDYIDNDDYITPFPWCTVGGLAYENGGVAHEWVFGTELPRLVLNEIYGQQDSNNVLSAWAELHNTFKVTPTGNTFPLDGGTANLTQPAVGPKATPASIYQIAMARPAASYASDYMKDPLNHLGIPPVFYYVSINGGPVGGTFTLAYNGTSTAPIALNPIATLNTRIQTALNLVMAAQNGVDKTGAISATYPTFGVPIYASNASVLTSAGSKLFGGKAPNVTVVPVGTALLTTHGAPGRNDWGLTTSVTPTDPTNRTGGTSDINRSNTGFYVAGPFPAAIRNPGLPTTANSKGMSFSQVRNIDTVAKKGATEAGKVVTITTIGAHGFSPNDQVVIAGLPIGYNGTQTISTIPSALTFTYVAKAGLPPSGGGTATLVPPAKISLLLRRLANPHLPPQTDPTNKAQPYNPYVTIDYMDNVLTTDTATAPSASTSYGRIQPYAGDNSVANQLLKAQTTNFGGNQPKNSFYQHNDSASKPFYWLQHLDRPPVNPIELLQVSGFRPHELTQKFISSAGTPNQHYAPWNPYVGNSNTNAQNSLLYRALDLMSTRYTAGTMTGGRFQGNININTMTDIEVWRALCDAHDLTASGVATQYPQPLFNANTVDGMFKTLINQRNTIVDGSGAVGNYMNNYYGPGTNAKPGGDGKPFKSLASSDVNDTVLRMVGANPFMQINTASHPAAQSALLQKVYNNISTTSNTFAIWWTVGYFEVVDESVSPPRLGQELGRSENRNIRHRFFAIVDRSGMELFRTNTSAAVAAGTNVAVAVPSMSGLVDTGTPSAPALAAKQWSIQPGMLLEVDGGSPNQEVVIVKSLNIVKGVTLGFFADFTMPHAAGANLTCRGNPGANYSPQLFSTINSNNILASAFPQFVTPTQMTGSLRNGQPWAIQPGMMLQIGTGANAETVQVTAVTATQFQAIFKGVHAAGTMICSTNTSYNAHQDHNVVLHLSVIK